MQSVSYKRNTCEASVCLLVCLFDQSDQTILAASEDTLFCKHPLISTIFVAITVRPFNIDKPWYLMMISSENFDCTSDTFHRFQLRKKRATRFLMINEQFVMSEWLISAYMPSLVDVLMKTQSLLFFSIFCLFPFAIPHSFILS